MLRPVFLVYKCGSSDIFDVTGSALVNKENWQASASSEGQSKLETVMSVEEDG